MIDINSPTYPYEKVQSSYSTYPNLVEVVRDVVEYLMDLPLVGYEPKTTNEYPRVRLMKYLYHDGKRPLDEEALTTEQKLSILYNPYSADEPPTGKGYRIFPLSYINQTQINAQTVLRAYIGDIRDVDVYTRQVTLIFDVLTNMAYETNTKSDALSRCVAMEQALCEALIGVNFDFCIGTVIGAGSRNISDSVSNVGRQVKFTFTMRSATE